MKETFLKVLEWIGGSPFRLFAVILLGIGTGLGWFVYTEKDAFMASYRAQQALPHMNGKYEQAANFIFKNSRAELVAIFDVNQLLNTRKLVYFATRTAGRDRENEGLDVGLLTKNHSNNNDVITLMSGHIPCGVYSLPQSQIGFVYKENGINYMCRASVPIDPGSFIGQISVGWKEEPENVELDKTVMTVASGLLYKPKR